MHELRRPASGFQQWTLTGEESQPYFRQAVELGITFWDTANVYSYGGSEEIVDGRPSGSYAPSARMVIPTECASSSSGAEDHRKEGTTT
jgi:aryl-alcohol dehydrogenase-like predicted oxidoreductase